MQSRDNWKGGEGCGLCKFYAVLHKRPSTCTFVSKECLKTNAPESDGGCVSFEPLRRFLSFPADLTLDSDAVPETVPMPSYLSFLISASNKTLSS